MQAWRQLKLPAGRWSGTGSRSPGTAISTFVMHMIAVCQARSDPRGGAYHRKKLAEGKSRREAMRCLKRRVSDAVFKALVADSRRASLAVA
jgi:hypothetical protein